MEWMCPHGLQSPDLNLIGPLWGDMEVDLGQIWGRVSDPEAPEAAAVEACKIEALWPDFVLKVERLHNISLILLKLY